MQATARSLFGFHADRAAVYRAIADLLARPPSLGNVGSLRTMLGDASVRRPAAATLYQALEAARAPDSVKHFHRLMSDTDHPLAGPCSDAHNPCRTRAFRVSGQRGDDSPAGEAMVLSSLADQAARALRAGDMIEASQLCAVQHDFLQHHAVRCLGSMSLRLIDSNAPYLERLGRAIVEITREDMMLLDGATRPASPR